MFLWSLPHSHCWRFNICTCWLSNGIYCALDKDAFIKGNHPVNLFRTKSIQDFININPLGSVRSPNKVDLEETSILIFIVIFNAFRKIFVYSLTVRLAETRQFLSLIGSSSSWLFAGFHEVDLLLNSSSLSTCKRTYLQWEKIFLLYVTIHSNTKSISASSALSGSVFKNVGLNIVLICWHKMRWFGTRLCLIYMRYEWVRYEHPFFLLPRWRLYASTPLLHLLLKHQKISRFFISTQATAREKPKTKAN